MPGLTTISKGESITPANAQGQQNTLWLSPTPIAKPLSTQTVKAPTVITPNTYQNRINSINQAMTTVTAPNATQAQPAPAAQGAGQQPGQMADGTTATPQATTQPSAIDQRLKQADWSKVNESTYQNMMAKNNNATGITKNTDGTYSFDTTAQKTHLGDMAGIAGTDQAGEASALNNIQQQMNQALAPVQQMLTNIASGQSAVPLNADQQSILVNMQTRFDEARRKLEDLNRFEEGRATNFMSSFAGAESNPVQAAQVIANVTRKGIQAIQSHDAEAGIAIAELRQSMVAGNADLMEKAYTKVYNALQDRSVAITNMARRIEDTVAAASAQAQKAEDQIHTDARQLMSDLGTSGAPADVISAIGNLVGTPGVTQADLSKAYGLSARYLKGKVTPTGSIQEYEFYKADQEALGMPALSYNEYQTLDANRKARVASAGAAILQSTGLSEKDTSRLQSIMSAYNGNTVIREARSTQSKLDAAINGLIANPTGAMSQLQGIYASISGLDPGTAVKEGEIALFNQVQSMWQEAAVRAARTVDGRLFTEETAIEMVDLLKALKSSNQQLIKDMSVSYEAQANVLGLGSQMSQFTSAANAVENDFNKALMGSASKNEEISNWVAQSPENQSEYTSWKASNPEASINDFYDIYIRE